MGWEAEEELGLHLMPTLVQGSWYVGALVADVGTLTSSTKAQACQQSLLKWAKQGQASSLQASSRGGSRTAA